MFYTNIEERLTCSEAAKAVLLSVAHTKCNPQASPIDQLTLLVQGLNDARITFSQSGRVVTLPPAVVRLETATQGKSLVSVLIGKRPARVAPVQRTALETAAVLLLQEVRSWEYEQYLLCNADALTEYVRMVLLEDSSATTVEFGWGTGIFNLTNTHIGINLGADVLCNLDTLLGVTEYEREQVAQSILESFMCLPSPVCCLQRRTSFVKAIGVYTTCSIQRIIHESYRALSGMRSGIGAYENDGRIAIIEKFPCDEATAKELQQTYPNQVTIIKNVAPTSSDCRLWTEADGDCETVQIRGHRYIVVKPLIAHRVLFGFLNYTTLQTGTADDVSALFQN